MNPILITIDGPAGAGKTTVSRNLAKRLGYRYIDTGALYRGVAFEAKARGISHDDSAGLEKLCMSLKLEFISTGGDLCLLSNNKDITDQIRSPEISMFASAVSANPVVREYLLGVQKTIGQGKSVVFEGRDMGSVVFPDAEIKFFLDASLKTRALRRYKELSSKTYLEIEKIEKDIKQRDENDMSRSLSPLRPSGDAIIIDSTDLSAEEVVDSMLLSIPEYIK